ncbi:hypothetical protein ACS0TY_000378 [Phlomoides rotata]
MKGRSLVFTRSLPNLYLVGSFGLMRVWQLSVAIRSSYTRPIRLGSRQQTIYNRLEKGFSPLKPCVLRLQSEYGKGCILLELGGTDIVSGFPACLMGLDMQDLVSILLWWQISFTTFCTNIVTKYRLHFIGTWRNQYCKRFPSLSNGLRYARFGVNTAVVNELFVIHIDMVNLGSTATEIFKKMSEGRHTRQRSEDPIYGIRVGVKAGILVKEAKTQCPDLVIVPCDFGAYEMVADQFYDILHKHCNKVQSQKSCFRLPMSVGCGVGEWPITWYAFGRSLFQIMPELQFQHYHVLMMRVVYVVDSGFSKQRFYIRIPAGVAKMIERRLDIWDGADGDKRRHLTAVIRLGYAHTAPSGQMDLSMWERFYLIGRGHLSLRELDYWPPQDRDVNQRSLSLPAAGLLQECVGLRRLRKLFIHGTAHEHFMMFLLRILDLRDVQLREDYYPAPENDMSTEMRADSCSRFEAALNRCHIPD